MSPLPLLPTPQITSHTELSANFFCSSNSQQSREFVEILSRSDEGAELLRRLNLFGFHPVNKTPVFDFRPLSARENADLD